MSKEYLVNEVASVIDDKREAQAAVECIFETIIDALKRNDRVAVAGFGTFKVDRRKARKGRNPRTGEEMEIQAKNVPKFVPAKALKDAVSELASS